MAPFLVSINVLERFAELRETFYLLDYWFIIKGYNSGTVMEEMQRARYGERAQSFHCEGEWGFSPVAPLASDIHVFTNLEALQTPSCCFFMAASSYRHD